MTNLKKATTSYFNTANTTGTLTTVPKSTTITGSYSTSTSVELSSDTLARILKDSIEDSLKEEDKDGTLSKLITSIVLDKMYELSGMSEEELVETELYKRISDKVDQRLAHIENRLSSLENAVAFINLDKLRESPTNYSYNYPPTNTGGYEYYGGTA